MDTEKLIKEIRFDEKGLVPAIIQDYQRGDVLMVAYMNEEAVRRTLKVGETFFWSRSRKTLWRKGDLSGNVQRVREIRLDCDNDCLLLKVEQVGGAACHTGYRSCFYRHFDAQQGLVISGERVFDPKKVYGKEVDAQEN